MSIETMMKNDKTVSFVEYKDGELWYRTTHGFDFPVPVNHHGNAAFLVQERTMQFMR